MSMLNNANNEGYAIQNISDKSNKLINGISNFAVARTRQATVRIREKMYIETEAVLKKFAERMDKSISINSEIGRYIAALESRAKQNNYHMER